MPEGTDKEKSWPLMRKCDSKLPIEALISSIQEQAIRTSYVKYHIDKSVESLSCRLCGKTDETIRHIVTEYSKVAQTEYKRMVCWKLCEKFNLEKSEKCYLHNPQSVTDNVNHRLIWDMNIQCDGVIVERKPDIVIVNKMEKTAVIINVAIPGDKSIIDKEKKEN